MTQTTDPTARARAGQAPRFHAWPLWGAIAGLLGVAATVFLDTRAGDTDDLSYTVSADDMAALDHEMFRIGGLVGYAAVAALLVFAAVWHRRVAQRISWSLGAPVVTYGLIASAAALSLAYGWKGALGNYLHGAAEEGTYDDGGLFVYYVMNDFSPFIGWVPVSVSLAGLCWMSFVERLVSRALGAFLGVLVVLIAGAVAVTGVPGLPFAAALGLLVAGIWLAFGRSRIVREEE